MAKITTKIPSLSNGGIPEAPMDGLQYGRQNSSWTIVNTSGDFTNIVYVDDINPNISTIFDISNPPLFNDDSLKSNVSNLYIGNDSSTWVYNTTISQYITKSINSTSNFYIKGTLLDSGNNKSLDIERLGSVSGGNAIANNDYTTLQQVDTKDTNTLNYAKTYTDGLVVGKEDKTNKQNSLATDGTGSKYPTVDAVNLALSTFTVLDATTTAKGIVKLGGDLGGTADNPTTPTAVHKTGNEDITGFKTFNNSSTGGTGIIGINNQTGAVSTLIDLTTSASASGSGAITINHNSSGTGLKIEAATIGNNQAILVNNSTGSNSSPFAASKQGLTVFIVDANGNISANSFTKKGGLASQFLKADGSVDSNTYLTSSYTAPVNSVAGKVGVVTLDKTDIVGLQPDLDLKANDTNVIHKTGNETKSGELTLLNRLVLGTNTGSPQNLIKFPADSYLKYNNSNASQYDFNITSLGADNFFWVNDEGNSRQVLFYGDGDSAIDSDIFGISSSQDSGATWNKAFSITQGGVGYVRSSLTASSFIKRGATASNLLKADGSDITQASLPISTATQTALNAKIGGTGTIGFIPKFTASGTLGNSVIVESSGKILIGTGTAIGIFNIAGANGGSFFDESNATYNRWKSHGSSQASAKALMISAQASGMTPDIYINSSGKVGIGNASPSVELDVVGTIKSSILSGTGDRNVVAGSDGTLKIESNTTYTVSTLPTGILGKSVIVTDATAPTYLGLLVGGGSVVCRAFYNGTNWVSN